MENKNILIQKQELIQDVYCANIINTVRNGYTVIITTADHLNNEERKTILEICEHFSDVFHLENNYLTFTNAAEHIIRLLTNQPPIFWIYKRPYRLSQFNTGAKYRIKLPSIFNENIKETHKFVIMDFEFSMVNKASIVVIFGAISNSLDRFKIRQLERRPLLLPLNEEARPMGETELQVAVREIKRVFRVKTDLRDACLNQLKQSLNSTKNNLTKGYIDSYIRRDLDQYPMLNITCYDKYFNKNFYIQFEKLNNREIIFEINIGTYDKPERLLYI
ncbi:Uncharacterized protein FWK35_00031570, partial [Aphis craccivora]